VEPGVPPPAGPAWSDFIDRFEPAYRAEFAAFVQVAQGQRSSPCTALDGVQAVRIAEAATTALKEHRIVPLAEVSG
jgi:myo-inositol 2-dehydrogenase/D-chiro-inositol 1-dehydrogenase